MAKAGSGGIAGDELRAFVERVERVQEEIDALNTDKSEIYSEAKGVGFDVAIMKRVIQYRRKPRDEAEEQDVVFDTYMRAIEGIQFGTRRATRARTTETEEVGADA